MKAKLLKSLRIDGKSVKANADEPVIVNLSDSEFDRLAEYACTVGGFAASICGQIVLTVYLAATDELTYIASARGIVNTCGSACFRRPPFQLIRSVPSPPTG